MFQNKFLLAVIAVLYAVSIPHMAFAANASDIESRLSLGLGYYDVFDDKGAADVRAEYRHGEDFLMGLKPWFGAELTSDGGAYGAVGLYYDWMITDSFYMSPSFGAGLYADGGGKDLGHAIEFRSQIEFGFEFEHGDRLGLALSHLSNAGIGDKNPGTEVLTLYYHMPIVSLFSVGNTTSSYTASNTLKTSQELDSKPDQKKFVPDDLKTYENWEK